jgi:L-histidine N-alpha-methyltransferase
MLASGSVYGLLAGRPGITLCNQPRAGRRVPPIAVRYRVDVHLQDRDRRQTLADDVRRGLQGHPRSLPPKYFYDAAGSALFERITTLPEYYLTRVEAALLERVAPAVMAALAPEDLVELGPGSSLKTRRFLDARNGGGPLRYVPIDVDASGLAAAADQLVADYPFLHVHGLAGDFERHLAHVPSRAGRRLVLFLGSTIGNLDPPERHRLLSGIRALLRAGDRFLLGVDLVKDAATLEAAYNDAAGVTREFNRNILRVVNGALGGDFRPEVFEHVAFYDAARARIEMHLVAAAPQVVRLAALDLTVRFAAGEGIWTESSYKFTPASIREALEKADLTLDAWHTDAGNRFALALAGPR